MKKKMGCLVIALFLFFPAAISVPAVAQAPMTFVMAYPSDIGELNPIYWRSERSHWYDMCVYDTLLAYDENLDRIPWLAEDFSVSADGLNVTFTLRTGATWHDGEPVTPDDVKFTFEHIRDTYQDANWWTFLQTVTDVIITGNEIKVVTNQLNSFAADNLGEIYILPKHIRQGMAANHSSFNDATNVTAHTGSGPFKFVERVPDEYTELERFDNWWGPDNPNVGQLPNIEVLRIDVVRGQDARILSMRNGDADTERYEVFGAYVQTILDAPELQLVQGVASQWDYILGMNTTLPGLDDLDVRRAIAYAINREQLITIGRLGHGSSTTSVIPEVFYPGLYSADGDFPAQNVTMAEEILDNAGWVDSNADGVRDKGGVELAYDLWTLSWDDISVATGTALLLQLEAVGFEINMEVVDDDPMYIGIYELPRTYDMYTMADGYGAFPDHPWWRMHSDNDVDWGSNPFGWVNSTFDTILDDYLAATPAELADAARAVQVAAVENMPYIPLYLSDDTHALRAEWANFSMKPGGPFTAFAPETLVFMYDSSMMPTGTVTTTTPTTTTEPPPPPGGVDMVLLAGVGAVALVVGVVCTYFVIRRQ
ncbi:MAG: ABC transporter substrate-binding protein [Candidatus Thorarchaeota archaeon]|jgi:peptide/nickel transport system substrate-binding protein